MLARTLWCYVSPVSMLVLCVTATFFSFLCCCCCWSLQVIRKSVDGRTRASKLEQACKQRKTYLPFPSSFRHLALRVSESFCNYWNLEVKLFAGESKRRHLMIPIWISLQTEECQLSSLCVSCWHVGRGHALQQRRGRRQGMMPA